VLGIGRLHETHGVLISEHLDFCVAKINVAMLPDTAPTKTASSLQFGILFSYIDNKCLTLGNGTERINND
jgi:hypothetical protein